MEHEELATAIGKPLVYSKERHQRNSVTQSTTPARRATRGQEFVVKMAVCASVVILILASCEPNRRLDTGSSDHPGARISFNGPSGWGDKLLG